MERIGIYGGSFNPVHLGHLRAAEFAQKAFGLQKLLLIPSNISCHKDVPADSPTPAQRLKMLQLAADGCPGVEVCDLELQRGGVSYTWQTLTELRQQYPDAEFLLLVGTDMFLSLHRWMHPEEIFRQATVAVLDRCEKNREKLMQQAENLQKIGANVLLAHNPVLEISSTQLRRLLYFGAAEDFLPKAVSNYIRQHKLYGTGLKRKNLPMGQLETEVIKLLKPQRVPHVLGCRDTAVEMARKWGVNEEDAARAGLLHDVTKALDGPLQLNVCSAYGQKLGEFSRKNPKTLHALTGSLVAQRIFGENEAVVSAICSHTTGKANMNTLEKIIYVADYMEPNRDFPGVEELRRLAFTNLDGALKLGLTMTLDLLKEQGRDISPESQQAIDWLNANENVNNP